MQKKFDFQLWCAITIYSLQVMKSMQEELGKGGMDEDEILQKTKALVKAFGKDESESSMLELTMVSKQANSALKKAEISPKEFVKVSPKQFLIYSIY